MKLLIGLIIEYQDTLYRIAKLRLNNEEDVCDAVQNTLISVYKSLNSLKNTRYFKTWLIRILINKCNDFYLAGNREYVSYDFLENNKVYSIEDFTNNFGLDSLINSLSKEEQTILTLYYSEGYKEKEIAKILDINYATVRSKIKRAKDKLALKLEKEEV